MKGLRKYILTIAIVFALFGVVNIVSAESDGTGDLWHYKVSGTSYSWEAYTGERVSYQVTYK